MLLSGILAVSLLAGPLEDRSRLRNKDVFHDTVVESIKMKSRKPVVTTPPSDNSDPGAVDSDKEVNSSIYS